MLPILQRWVFVQKCLVERKLCFDGGLVELAEIGFVEVEKDDDLVLSE
jgi:hypothetical protein